MMRITTEIRGLLSGKVPPRTMVRLVKEAMSDEAVAWREQTLPEHFREGARLKYHYQPRTRKYLARKQKQVGHKKAMVYTGAAMRKIQADRRKPVPTQLGVVLKLKSPGFFHYQYKGWPSEARMGNEVKRTTREERREMARGMAARLKRKIAELKSNRAYYVKLRM